MSKLTGLRRASIAAAVLTATSLSSGVAVGQEASAALEEIVITGTRIANPNAVSSSPILAVSAENIRLQGIVDAGDLVDQLPQNITTVIDLSNTNNPLSGPGGVTTMNLRGLGPQRTLVLIDGRRLGVGDPNSGNPNPAPDINQIPSALIERVDIVTGGASAVYGSDAIAGVANFIMRRDFEGVQIDAQYGFNWHDNNSDYMQGLVDDRGPALPEQQRHGRRRAGRERRGGRQLRRRQGQRDRLPVVHRREADPPVRARLLGLPAGGRRHSAAAVRPTRTTSRSSTRTHRRRQIRLASSSVFSDHRVDGERRARTRRRLFNSNPYMNLKHGRERYQGGVFAKYEWSERATLYTDFMFMKDQAETAVAPSGLFIGAPIPVFCNNSLHVRPATRSNRL